MHELDRGRSLTPGAKVHSLALQWITSNLGTGSMHEIALAPGAKGVAELLVEAEHTAPHVGSGKIAVLATPVMVNLMEAASLAAVEVGLPEGYQTLGIHLEVSHVAATPVGMRVRARAELVKVHDRRLTFRVSAEDECELIGEGTHERVIVDVARFDQRVQKKAGAGKSE